MRANVKELLRSPIVVYLKKTPLYEKHTVHHFLVTELFIGKRPGKLYHKNAGSYGGASA